MRNEYSCSRVVGGAALALMLAGSSLPAVAEEAGQWHGKGVLVIIDKTSVKVEDRPNHTVAITEYDGVIYNEDGKPFLDKARYQVVTLNDTAVSRGGYKTFTAADGSKAFAKYSLTESNPPEYRGTFEFTGGTGKYEGITGNGTFHITYVTDRVGYDELSGEYRIPTGTAASSKPPATDVTPSSKK
jgi:hypothetical protein